MNAPHPLETQLSTVRGSVGRTMTRNELASLISKYEGKKVEVSIGNIREVLRILNDALTTHGIPFHTKGSARVINGIDVLKALLK